MVNPSVFFDIVLVREPLGCVSFKLFADKIPKTAENFNALSSGETGVDSKSSCFQDPWVAQQLVSSHAIYGTGWKSIYGEKFDDENFILKHMGPGILSMANAGPNKNSPQFFLRVANTGPLDGNVWSLAKGKRA
ncbi:unnamed protein product [Nyctereutes procyonoides]|uniref:Peptidyl-prolyl cis-trans isomerase n=1 Tax=Nyctereutes procyonoides TaxID=34880 RepID=A0A811YBE3_NYCPR|nr:unnamed protein product [Nyctereutes procyonoides]